MNFIKSIVSATIFCLIGLLAVGMTTVHSKRQVSRVGTAVYELERKAEDLERRNVELDTKLAHYLKPNSLKHMASAKELNLQPPAENRIILVRPVGRDPESRYYLSTRNTVQPRPSQVVVQN